MKIKRWSREEIEFLMLVYTDGGTSVFRERYPARSQLAIMKKAFKLKIRRNQSGSNNPFFGRHHTLRTRGRMSNSKLGIPPWNKGKRQWSERPHPFLGKHHSDETKAKLREKAIGRKYSESTRLLWSKQRSGAGNSNWKGGITQKKYPDIFSDSSFKDNVRLHYCNTCVSCLKTGAVNGRKLSVHHIDFNKKNCDLQNLIPLCNHCHGIANAHRDDSSDYFNNLVAVDVMFVSFETFKVPNYFGIGDTVGRYL